MLYSMTGFGRAEFTYEDKSYVIEIRSLNGKNMDINCKMPSVLKSIENDIRKTIQSILVRGTVDCQISQASAQASRPMTINKELAKTYYRSIQELTGELGIEPSNILQTLLAMPEVVSMAQTDMDEAEKEAILEHTAAACNNLVSYRRTEGESLYEELKLRIHNIMKNIPGVELHEKNRVTKIRDRMIKNLSEIREDITYDVNRLEQEMIYYLEKLDISEEKQRLTEHGRLFMSTLDADNIMGIGKKLNFILQEIGREVNTLGSKANDADIQKIVIDMKDELEKAKEQSLNVL